jgi:ADP-heptose:LPS heptosyltransferase
MTTASAPSLSPAEHAAAIITWAAGRDVAAIESGIAASGCLAHADALADAADSDDEVLRSAGLGALFAGLVEPLNDGFTPAGRAVYARVFTRIVYRVAARDAALAAGLRDFGITDETGLLARVVRARMGASSPLQAAALTLPMTAERIVVLSRVTIGADVLLTSVALQRLRQRFPAADIVLLGDAKLGGLFGGMPGVRMKPISYARRGPLRARLASWLTVLAAMHEENPDLVLAPDSRLDQLGILPVVQDPLRYLLWENLQPDGRPRQSLAGLFDAWLAARLGLDASPAVVPALGFDQETAATAKRLAAAFGGKPLAAVKLDHGGNPAKSLPRAAEIALLQRLRAQGWRILLDRGFGPDELANSDALLAAAGWTANDICDRAADAAKGIGRDLATLAPGSLAYAPVIRVHGSIATWAAALAHCRLALSYDSVGHHLAAALGVPVVVAFTGYADPGFPVAWQPRGKNAVTVVQIETADKAKPEAWARVMAAIPAAP